MSAADFDRHVPIALSRDCPAVLIPEGTVVTLSEGTAVYVTQALGGSVTVNVNGNLARIAATDVDALGMERDTGPAQGHTQNGEVDESLIWDCLLYTSPSPRDVEESRMPSSA